MLTIRWFVKFSRRLPLGVAAGVIALAVAVSAPAREDPVVVPHWLEPAAVALCKSARPDGAFVRTVLRDHGVKPDPPEVHENSSAAFRAGIKLDAHRSLSIRILRPGATRRQVQLTLDETLAGGSQHLLVRTDSRCRIALARVLVRDSRGGPVSLLHFDDGLAAPPRIEPLNPPVPAGADPGGVAIALIDTGIAYTLPVFTARLARDGAGRILGHDFADDDRRPYDLDPSTSPLLPRRHGSAVASIIVREAPDARLIPLRYPANDFAAFADIVAAIARSPARIVAMPLGGYVEQQWRAFASAARQHREILFIVSAGNDGRDIAIKPVYPASFAIDNMLVVTSSDAFGNLAAGSNWSKAFVDISTPGERINVIDHRGAKGKASGSSYAVPRIVALAARLQARHADWSAKQIKAAIIALAGRLPGRREIRTRHGWIANPAIE